MMRTDLYSYKVAAWLPFDLVRANFDGGCKSECIKKDARGD